MLALNQYWSWTDFAGGGPCIPVIILNGVSAANIHSVSVDIITLAPCGGNTYIVTKRPGVSDNKTDDVSYEGYEYDE